MCVFCLSMYYFSCECNKIVRLVITKNIFVKCQRNDHNIYYSLQQTIF